MPRQADFYGQALALYQANRHEEALAICRKGLASMPQRPSADALILAGVLCNLTGELSESETHLRGAVAAGGGAQAYANLALTLSSLHKLDEAEAAYRSAVELDPHHSQAWNNLGNLLGTSFRPERKAQAIECYRQALVARPGYVNAHVNLGFALEANGELAAAEENYRIALSHAPRFQPALVNLADLLERTMRFEEALDVYRRAIEVAPDNAKLIGSAIGLRRKLADWNEDVGPSVESLVRVLRQDKPSELQPLALLALHEVDAALQRRAAECFARARWAAALAQPALVSPVAVARPGRLRIGYLSADFRNHPVSHLVTAVIAAQDRERFEVFLYAYGPDVDDAPRRALREASDHFIVISAMDDHEAACRIRDDGIDILVDLTGYTTHTRLGITARRPAPVIVSWLGYIGTLGEARLADYVIGDAIATPPALAAHFSEALALMPECFQPNAALEPLPPPSARGEEGLPSEGVVFCSFNQTFKLTPQLWDDWCRILQAVPGSVLWLAPAPELAQANLRRKTQRRGVAPERLVFATRKPLAEHQARIALADIALDTYPYNSGTTASDALRAGVPLITRMGGTFVSRMAASLLTSLGMTELITTASKSYVECAVALAQDHDRRSNVRQTLCARLPESTLFQPKRFAGQLDALYLAMHAQACRGARELIDLRTA